MFGDRVAVITERLMRVEIVFQPAPRQRVKLLAAPIRERHLADVPLVAHQRPARRAHARRQPPGRGPLTSSSLLVFVSSIARCLRPDRCRPGNCSYAAIERAASSTGEGDRVDPRSLTLKLGALQAIAAAKGLALAETLAVGDGANDLAMLKAAGLGVAYRAKPKVAANADARIDHADLTALLYAQGISRKEFVEG